jgi:hypothetical protein
MTVSSHRMLTAPRLLAESGELIDSHGAENARTGVYVVPCRPDILDIPTTPERATQVPSK